ncbi:hypothetical protein LEMLEM_LOCUS9369 [Lemmus lemmus]
MSSVCWASTVMCPLWSRARPSRPTAPSWLPVASISETSSVVIARVLSSCRALCRLLASSRFCPSAIRASSPWRPVNSSWSCTRQASCRSSTS